MPMINLLGIALTILGLVAIYLTYRSIRKQDAQREREEMKRIASGWNEQEWREFIAEMMRKESKCKRSQ